MRRLVSVLTLATLAGVAIIAGACGGDENEANTIQATATVVDDTPEPTAAAEPTEEPSVKLGVKEWSISADVSSVPVGDALFEATNLGTIPHEVVFLRTDRPVGDLPIGSDNKVNRFAEGIEDLGVIRTDALVPGATVRESFALPAGNYALICNVPGHYAAGMFTAFSIA